MSDEAPLKVTSIIYEPSAEMLAKWEAWASAPERMHIEDIIRGWPPWHCYRSTEHPKAHYAVHGYTDDGTVRVLHGADSTIPGWEVLGYEPAKLTVCDCKTFKFAMGDEVASAEEASMFSQGTAEITQ